MGTYKFTSPEGTVFHGEGSSPEEAFGTARERDPNELAAMRTRQSVRHGASEPQVDIPEAAQAVQRGDYGPLREQAFESGTSLARTAMPALGAIGDVLSPTATAGGMFDAEPDAKKRKSLEKQYREATPRGQREIVAQYNKDQSAIQGEQRRIAESERQTEAGKQARADWFSQNADTIKSLPQHWQQQISGSGSLPEAQEMFNRAMEDKRRAGMTLAERYPASVLAGEAAGVAGDIYAPAKLASGRARALKQATEGAEAAYGKAYGPGARASKGANEAAQMARSKLQERAGLSSVSPTELALGAAVPYVAGNIPNSIDMLMGMLETDPAAREKVQRAFDSATDPMQFLRSIGVGFGATALGSFAGGARHDYGGAKADASGVLKRFSARDEALKRAAEDKAAKAAAKRQPKQPEALAGALRASDPSAALAPGGSTALTPGGGAFNSLQQWE
jgi:hypothetical protein